MIGRSLLWQVRFQTLGPCTAVATLSMVLGCQSDGWDPHHIREAESRLIEAQESWLNGQSADACRALDSAIEQGGLCGDQLAEAGLLRFECLLQLGRFSEAQTQLEWLENLDAGPHLDQHRERLATQRERHRTSSSGAPLNETERPRNGDESH